MRKTKNLTVAVLGAAVFASPFIAAPAAQAAPTQAGADRAYGTAVEHGWDQAWTSTNNKIVSVKDNECDDHGVKVEYYRKGSDKKHVLWDVGSPSGCWGNAEKRESNNRVTKLRICEVSEGCSAWKKTGA